MSKRRFFIFGILNTLISNTILQILLLFFQISKATLISQSISLIIGFYLHGKFVFINSKLSVFKFFKYLIFAYLLWIINWSGIYLISNYGINKNLSALLLIPFIALISYLMQKKIVFV